MELRCDNKMSEKLEQLITDLWDEGEVEFYDDEEEYDPREALLIKPRHS